MTTAPHQPVIHTVQAEQVAAQPWRNGGGLTRELLAWPSAQDWGLRISRADIGQDGAFSAFHGVERWFAVLSGAGVRLEWPTRQQTLQHTLRVGDAPLRFDGGDAPHCYLLDGATQDLNAMLRAGRGAMLPVQTASVWESSDTLRALYTAVAGTWSDGLQARDLPAHTLLWSLDHPQPWRFTTSSTLQAWWIGFTPHPAPL